MMRFMPCFVLACVFFCANASAQIVLNKTADMFFGTLGYDTSHSGTVQLGTNGTVAIIGGTGLSHNGGGSPASIDVTGTPADVIEIKCQTGGKLRNSNKSITLQNPEVAIDTGVAFGSGNACADIKKNSSPAITVDLAVNSTPTVLMGAELVIANGLISGTYNTQGGGAKPVTLRVIFQ